MVEWCWSAPRLLPPSRTPPSHGAPRVQRTAHCSLDRCHRRATLRRKPRRVYMTAAPDHSPSHITHTLLATPHSAPNCPHLRHPSSPPGSKVPCHQPSPAPPPIDALGANRLGFLHERRFLSPLSVPGRARFGARVGCRRIGNAWFARFMH